MARIGWLSILLAVCAVLLPIKAQAAGYDIGRAMQDCRNSGSWNALNSARKCVDIGPQPGSKTECLVGLLATNGPGYLGLWTYTCAKKCDSRADYNGPYPNGQFKPTSGSLSCDLGCEVMWTHNADGTVNGSTALNKPCTGEDYDNDDKCNAAVPGGGYHYNAQVGVCEPSEPKSRAARLQTRWVNALLSLAPAACLCRAMAPAKRNRTSVPPALSAPLTGAACRVTASAGRVKHGAQTVPANATRTATASQMARVGERMARAARVVPGAKAAPGRTTSLLVVMAAMRRHPVAARRFSAAKHAFNGELTATPVRTATSLAAPAIHHRSALARSVMPWSTHSY